MSLMKKASVDTSLSDHSSDLSSLDDVREANSRLRAAIDAQHNQNKQLRREKAVEVKNTMEREQNKASIALKDQRLKLLQEKASELERLKEFMNKKFDADAAKILRQKEAEVNKVRDALTRCQTELSQVKLKGLSGDKARVNSFEGERSKLVREAGELRAQKKQLEAALKDAENKRQLDLQRAQKSHNTELSKVRREAEVEIRKLVEDIKGRDRQMAQLERDLQTQVAEATRLKIERDNMHQALKENEDNKRSPRKPTVSTSLADVSDSLDNPPGENGHDREPILKRQITELNVQIKRLETQCSSYKQDKADLVRKIAEVEKRQRPLGEKARRFLEKNMELTSINRNLEERIKTLTDDNNKLRAQLTADREEADRLSRSLDEEREEREAYSSLQLEVELLRQQVMEQDKTMTALKLACTEKDRRIELICHRRRKQRAVKAQQKAAGVKETYYGYDEDRSSVDSEMSTSSRLSSSRLSLDNTFEEDDVFDEFTREEFHRNYQRLAREHLELEKSCALLHSQVALSHVDPQREFKLRSQLENDLLSAQSRIEDLMKMVTEKGQDTKWLDEKEKLNNDIKSLKDKISEHEATITNLHLTVQEYQEQNEDLEFRWLELEENNKKLSEDVKHSVTFTGPVTLSQDGVLELYAEGQGLIDVKLDDLRSRLQQLTELQNGHFTRDEQVALLQTYALLNIIDQKLKENQEVEEELKRQLRQLEEELLDLHAAGVSKELAEVHKETVTKLGDTDKKLQELTSEVEELRKADAVHRYTEDFNQKAEERYKVEINSLRRQLSNSCEGRDYENELFLEKTSRLKELEQLVVELEAKKKQLEGDLETVRSDNVLLRDQVAMEEETQSLTESDKDTPTLLHSLRSKISHHERTELELSNKKETLEAEVVNLRKRLAEYETNESELTEKTFTLQEDLETTKRRQKSTEVDLVSTREELRSLQSQLSVGSAGVVSPRGRDSDAISIGSMSEADLSEDNQSMRVELFTLREQLKMKELEINRLGRNLDGDAQWKISALEKEMMDLRHENVTLKERLREKMKELDTVEDELGTSISEKKARIRSLEEEVGQHREDKSAMEKMVVEMKQEMFAMQEKLDLIRKGAKETELLEMRTKVQDLEEGREALEEELEAIDASRNVLKENAESLLRKESEYDQQIQDLHNQLKAKQAEIDVLELSQQTLQEDKERLESRVEKHESHLSSNELIEELRLQVKELEGKMSAMDRSEVSGAESAAVLQKTLEKKVQALEQKLKDAKERELQARDQLDLVVDEKDRRISFLQDQLDHLEESEACLNESLVDMRQLENQLREQLKEYEDLEHTTSTTGSDKDIELEVTKLRATENNLLGRIQELEETEKNLQKQLQAKVASKEEDSADKDEMDEKSDASKTVKLERYRKRCHDLEARVKELSRHESDLMEQIYAMQLENQELQEHIDLLQEASDQEDEEADVHRLTVQQVSAKQTASAATPKDPEQRDDRLAKIETENSELKDQLLKVKLDAMGSLSSPTPDRVAELEARVAELEKREEELLGELVSLQGLERKIAKLEDHRAELEAELEERAKTEHELREKIVLLEQSEDKLMEKLDTLAENESGLKEEVASLRTSGEEASVGHHELVKRVHQLEAQERELKAEIAELEGRRSDLMDKLDDARKSESSEVQRLQEKVDILLDTHERLIDRLQEQDRVENELNGQLETTKKEAEDLAKKLEATENETMEMRKTYDNSKMQMEETMERLKASQKEMDELKSELEKLSETEEKHSTELKAQVQKVGSFDQENTHLKEELDSYIKENSDLKKSAERVSDLERTVEDRKKECLDLTNKLVVKQKELADLQKAVAALETENSSQRERLKLFEEETVKLITKLKDTEAEVSRLKANLESSERESAQLKEDLKRMNELEESQEEAEKLKTQSNRRIKDLEQEVDQLTDQISSDKKELELLRDTLRGTEELEKLYEEAQKNQRISNLRIYELETSDKGLKDQVNELEKAEAILLTKIDGMESTIVELRNVERSLRQQISEFQLNEGDRNRRLVDLEKSEVKLQTKVSDLEVHNATLMATVSTSAQQTESHMHYHITEPAETVTVLGTTPDSGERRVSPKMLSPAPRPHSRSPSPPRAWDDLRDLERLEGMSWEELMSKVHELETMERFHRRRIRELSENLSLFRQAVEDVTVTLETDTDVPVISTRPKTKDSEYEAKVAELVKTEMNLKLRVFQLQKQEAVMRAEMTTAEQHMKDMEREFRAEVEELEEELDNVRKAEARLKNKIQYGQLGQENQALAKVQHLENLVFDLEASERKLQRRVHELQAVEESLLVKLKKAEDAISRNTNVPVNESDKYYDIIQQVLVSESSEKELKDTITKLGKKEDTEQARKIADLERSERILKKKVEMFECQELVKSSFSSGGDEMSSPEDLLRQRIKELEKLEQHSKKQVMELEHDREELHEITRQDKSLIHELNVKIRELELSEKNLKDQVNRSEAAESRLSLNIDELNDRLQHLEENKQKTQTSEKQLKQALQTQKSARDDLVVQLENVVADSKRDEQRLKKKIADLESKSHSLQERIDELTDRVGDLEGVEITMKSKLKTVESSELDLKSQLLEVEQSEGTAKTRMMELEAFNETLSQKVHDLGEENSSLRYEMSDLQIMKGDLGRELERVKLNLDTYKERLSQRDGSESGLVQRLEEAAEREATLMSRVAEYERMDTEWQSRVAALEANENKLRLVVQQQESSLSMANSKTQATEDVEKDNLHLQQQVNQLRSSTVAMETSERHLSEKLELYEYSHANKDMATIPREELVELRAQVALLAEMEKTVVGLESSEISLKATINRLREGKDVCGHEAELRSLREQVDHLSSTRQEREGLKRALNTTKKAHELLKENHEETKKELAHLLKEIKSGEVKAKGQGQMSSKAIQARLAQSYTLKDVSPELRAALKGLGARHPEAYQEFVRTLQPGHAATAAKPKGAASKKKSSAVVDDVIVAQTAATTATAGPGSQQRHHDDDRTAALGSKPESTLFTIGGGQKVDDSESEESSLTEEILLPLLLKGELISTVAVSAEDPLWASIEQQGGATVDLLTEREESYWANIESHGEVDDMTLSMTFVEETDSDCSLSHGGPAAGTAVRSRATSLHSNMSDPSLPPPPLPNTLPPPHRQMASPSNDSFYLPSSHHGDDSADEASEIAPDEDAYNRRRAASADRDSDFSESLPLRSSSQQRRKKLGQLTSSLDSIPDSGVGTLNQTDGDMLREKITALEKQLKSREKELELAQHNQRDLERKAKDADEAFTLKAKLKDRDRQLEVERKKKVDLTDKLTGVETQLSDRESNIHRLKGEIDRLQNTLKVAPESTDANESYLREEIDSKEKEVNAKNNEIDRLIQELRKTQDELRAVQDGHQKTVDELNSAQTEIDSSKDVTNRLTQLQLEHTSLVKEHGDLVDRHAQFTKANDEKAALEKIVLKLKGQLNDLERIDLERLQLETRSQALEDELKQMKEAESELTKEIVSLRRELNELRTENSKLSTTHADYNKVIAKYKNMEDIKNKAQLMVTPLRVKVITLSKKCQEKDNLINRLATDLRRSGEPSDLLAETDRVISIAASEEYNRPITPLPAEIFEEPEAVIGQSTYSAQPHRPRSTSQGSSGGSSSADSALDDTTNRFHNNRNKPLRTSSERKRGKADGKVSEPTNKPYHRPGEHYIIDDFVVSRTMASQPITVVGNGDSSTHTWPRKAKGHGQLPTATLFRAVKDYEPEHFSQSGHKMLELRLKENQEVKVIGPLDNRGYYEAEVDGKIGLVPAIYLEAVPSRTHSGKHQKHRHAKMGGYYGDDGSPEQILAMHAQLQQSHVPQHTVSTGRPLTMGGRLHTIVHPAFVRKPGPPQYRSTTMPRPTHKHHSTTSQRQRHSVQPPTGQTQNENGLLLPGALRRSLPSLPQTGAGVTTNGVQSPPPVDNSQSVNRAPVLAPPDPPSNFHIERIVGKQAVLLTWQPPSMDEMARSNGCTVTGYLIYINNRDKQVVPSPHMPKALVERLNLKRPNRFSIQSVASNGQRSNAVDVLFEDVLPESPQTGGREPTGRGDVSSVVSGGQNEDGERRVFMAVYDYNPTEHSPNDFPENELNFHTGELITVYGSEQPDGFYQAKLHGKRGLVPASFIEEVPLLRSQSRRSLSGSSQQGSRPNSRPSSIHGNLPKVATAHV